MKKTASKNRDLNQAAFEVTRVSTGEAQAALQHTKNPAAVALGRLGGLKGGKARAQILSEQRLSEIARKAAKARWKKR
jgi:hypothetical protein